MTPTDKPLALVTGATSGIGLQLAKLAAADGYALLLAADRPFDDALAELPGDGVETLEVDLSTTGGVAALVARVGTREVDVLCANAGVGLGGAFLDQDFAAVRRLIETDVVGTIDLVQQVGRRMRARGSGRILLTGSLAGLLPGAYQAAYNASKAFIDNFSFGLRNELKDSGVTVTCLMPSVTDTDFWERSGTLESRAGSGRKAPADAPAKAGWAAMKKGEGAVSPGYFGALQRAVLRMLPRDLLASVNEKQMRIDGD